MASKPPAALAGLRWLTRALVVGWAVFAFFFVDAEGSWAARMAIFAPALVPVAIAEYLVLRARERAALAAAAATLGLAKRSQLLGQRLAGIYRGCEVDFRTEAGNELGKGTCLEVRSSGLEGIAVGSRCSSRVLRRAAGQNAVKLDTGQRELEAYSADSSWQAALANLELIARLLVFSGGGDPARPGAVLGSRVLRAFYGRHQSFDEVKSFIDEAIDVAEQLRASRAGRGVG
ncbi:MAG: hypothetical protein HYZ28_27050 [Myxococcales bacterium]|nr:hypothetical protein [Myxococcales bacterium]